jgi:hypothetical protein
MVGNILRSKIDQEFFIGDRTQRNQTCGGIFRFRIQACHMVFYPVGSIAQLLRIGNECSVVRFFKRSNDKIRGNADVFRMIPVYRWKTIKLITVLPYRILENKPGRILYIRICLLKYADAIFQ